MENAARVLEMAGYYTANAVADVSSGELLMPIVGYLGADASRRMERLVMGSIDAVAAGDMKISNLGRDTLGAVLVKDGMVTLPTGKTDCLIVDVRFAADPDAKAQFLVPYRHAEHELGFAVHKPHLSVWEGLPGDGAADLTRAFGTGLRSHEEGSTIWNAHYVAEPGVSAGHHGEENTDFTLEEFQALRRTPFLVFFLVAAADGKVDQAEVKALVKLLLGAGKYASPLLSRIVTNVINDVPALLADTARFSEDFSGELARVGVIVDRRLPADDAVAFKQALLAVAHDVASASGGFFGFGSKISKSERAALMEIARCLGMAAA